MTEPPWTIRRAVAADRDFLNDMLVTAVNWSPGWNQSRASIFATPAIMHYVAGWPRRGDLGLVAEAGSVEAGGRRIGATWLRFLPETDPGYGFVAPDVPELTIGVSAPWRGRGVGRALLRTVADEASARGIRRISLSVERKNYARALYLSEGYRVVDSRDPNSDTMVRDLTPGPES
jgi:GNAT superfamily N-acetyltransferase